MIHAIFPLDSVPFMYDVRRSRKEAWEGGNVVTCEQTGVAT